MLNLKSIALGAAIAVGASAASAATYTDCSVDTVVDDVLIEGIADNVSSALDCEISSEDQDNVKEPLVVNAGDGFFGGGWDFVYKFEPIDSTNGSFDLTSLFDSYAPDIMLVFKDGAGTTLVGYLISSLTGTWTTPFSAPDFTVPNPKDVSHISVYSRIAPIPLPAGGVLLLSAIGGLALARRRTA